MGFKSHISWNALSYLEDKAKITITHNQADLEDEKKHAVLLAGYLKKDIELAYEKRERLQKEIGRRDQYRY